MDDFFSWLRSLGGSSDPDLSGAYDFSGGSADLFGGFGSQEESVFDPTFGGSMPLPPEMPEGSFDISDPAFYPRSEDNPFGYDPGESYNQPLPSVSAKEFLDLIKKGGSQALDYLKNNPGKVGLMAALTALGAMDKRPAYGGGTTKRYTGPAQQLTRTITQGKYGPIAKFAAQGGTMHAYANGGKVAPVPMQDGGFVMTKRAVDGAGGPQGIQSLVPQARMIRGPGTGTSDSIPAYIQGPNGQTPARVSNGEAYVPPQGDNPTERAQKTRQLYALMKSLERRA